MCFLIVSHVNNHGELELLYGVLILNVKSLGIDTYSLFQLFIPTCWQFELYIVICQNLKTNLCVCVCVHFYDQNRLTMLEEHFFMPQVSDGQHAPFVSEGRL